MSRLSDNIDRTLETIGSVFSATDRAREKALPLSRDVIRHSGQTIRALHRRQFDQATGKLKAAGSLLVELDKATDKHDELRYTGFFRDAQKEFAEASISLALVTGQPLPGPDQLGVAPAAYLNGLAEAASELRRYLLDSMRKDDLSRGEELLSAMDDIYNALVTVDFPDAITGGLRRTTDVFRSVLEKTRSDLTLAMQQKSLENRLDNFEQNYKGLKGD
jgi:translin